MPEQQIRYLKLSSVLGRIKEILTEQKVLGTPFWVKGDVTDLSEREHIYFKLVEVDQYNPKQNISINTHIWITDYQKIKRRFKEYGLDFVLKNNKNYGFKCEVSYDIRFGLTLRVVDVDVLEELSVLERNRLALINKLRNEGLFELNKQKKLPMIIKRIGFVTSADSSVYHDFMETIKKTDLTFKIFFADSRVQGPEAESGVLKALDALEKLNPDLVVLIRGGGSTVQLLDLDKESIARKIAAFKCPVWTGIGHQPNVSLLDFVANGFHNVPTKVATEIIEHNRLLVVRLNNAKSAILSKFSKTFLLNAEHIKRSRVGIENGTAKCVKIIKQKIELARSNVRNIKSKLIGDSQKLLDVKSKLSAKVIGIINRQRTALQYRNQKLSENSGNFGKTNRSIIVKKQYELRLRTEKCVNYKRCKYAAIQSELNRKSGNVLNSIKTKINRVAIKFNLKNIQKIIFINREKLIGKDKMLEARSPENNLIKGYTLTSDSEGNIITSVEQLAQADIIRTVFKDGKILSNIIEVNKNE